MDLTRRAFALGSLGLLAACAAQSHTTKPSPRRSPLVQVRAGTARRAALGTLSASQLADAQRAFGVDLLGKTCAAGRNTTLSPASAALALGLLTAGARGDTEKRISAMLHLPRWGDDVVAAYAAQHAVLARSRHQLQVANRVYSAGTAAPSTETLDDVATAFGAALSQLDFAGQPKAATDRINADVSKDTAGLIPKLFEDPLDPGTLTVLVNALHLKADWAEPFDKRDTTETPFTTDEGKTVTVAMMRGVIGTLRTDGDWRSVTLGYQGGALEMVAILPPKDAGCDALTAARLTALARGRSAGEAGLAMPKLDVSQTHHLLEVLAGLGLPITGDYAGYQCDTITDVVQKDVLKVDEKGTEAAAATAITMTASARMMPAEVVLDRPYLLLLQDVETGTPLFLSHVVDPTA